MRLGILGLMAAFALGMSSTAFTANRTYSLNLPSRSESPSPGFYTPLGWITTDGAATPVDADIVDYKITLDYSGPPQASYTLTPANSTFSLSGVTASLVEMTVGPNSGDHVTIASNLLCPVGGAQTFPCYEIDLENLAFPKEFYVVLGFGQVDEAVGGLTEPWAVASLFLVQPDTLWTGLRFYGTIVAGPVPVGPSGDPLLLMIAAAQRFFDANDEVGTCHSLDAVVHEANESNGDGNDQGDRNDSASASVVAYARAIESVIACPSGGHNGQN